MKGIQRIERVQKKEKVWSGVLLGAAANMMTLLEADHGTATLWIPLCRLFRRASVSSAAATCGQHKSKFRTSALQRFITLLDDREK